MKSTRALRVTAATPYEKWPLYLTFAEAGELLGVSERTISRMIAADELPVERHGRLKRIPKTAIRPQVAP